jgi:hypothetical protein
MSVIEQQEKHEHQRVNSLLQPVLEEKKLLRSYLKKLSPYAAKISYMVSGSCRGSHAECKISSHGLDFD